MFIVSIISTGDEHDSAHGRISRRPACLLVIASFAFECQMVLSRYATDPIRDEPIHNLTRCRRIRVFNNEAEGVCYRPFLVVYAISYSMLRVLLIQQRLSASRRRQCKTWPSIR